MSSRQLTIRILFRGLSRVLCTVEGLRGGVLKTSNLTTIEFLGLSRVLCTVKGLRVGVVETWNTNNLEFLSLFACTMYRRGLISVLRPPMCNMYRRGLNQFLYLTTRARNYVNEGNTDETLFPGRLLLQPLTRSTRVSSQITLNVPRRLHGVRVGILAVLSVVRVCVILVSL